jgi:hypothetical protein
MNQKLVSGGLVAEFLLLILGNVVIKDRQQPSQYLNNLKKLCHQSLVCNLH